MASDYHEALNLGTPELVTINQLVQMVADAAGKKIKIRHNLTGPQGVRGRNSEIPALSAFWAGAVHPAGSGLAVTYKWIASEMRRPVHSEKYGMPELAKSGD